MDTEASCSKNDSCSAPDAIQRLNESLNEKSTLSRRVKSCLTAGTLKKRLPPLTWLPNYSAEDLKGDLIAGLSVSFTLIPQALAMALLAQLPMQNGLYSSFIGPFVYVFFGSCKDITVGPTSIMAIITAKYASRGGVNQALLLSLFAGIVQLVFSLFGMGFLVEFISFPVISAFSTAAAITIFVAQLKPFLGVQAKHRLADILHDFSIIRVQDALLGCFCFIILVSLKIALMRLTKRPTAENTPIITPRQTGTLCGPQGLKMFIYSRNALIVIICALLGYLLGSNYFILTQDIKPGLPEFRFPTLLGAANETIWDGFVSTVEDLNYGILIVAFLSFLETIAIAKSIENSSKLSSLTRSFDATQEMFALGLSNVLGACVGSFPVTGSFTRSAINHSSGVRSPLSNVVSGCMVLLALSSLVAPYFHYIPQTTLASIIMSSVVFMMKPGDVAMIYRSNKVDLIPYVTTFITCVFFSLEFGILIGVGFGVLVLLYGLTKPKMHVSVEHIPNTTYGRYLVVTPKQSIYYPSVESFKMKIIDALKIMRKEILKSDGVNGGQIKLAVVIDCSFIADIDSTFVLSFEQFMRALEETELLLVLYSPTQRISSTFTNFKQCDDKKSLMLTINRYYHVAEC